MQEKYQNKFNFEKNILFNNFFFLFYSPSVMLILMAVYLMLVWTKNHFGQNYAFQLKDFLILWATLGIYQARFSRKIWITILFLCWCYIDFEAKIICFLAFILQNFYEGTFITIFKCHETTLLYWRKNLWLKPLCIGLMWTLATLILPMNNRLELTKVSCFLLIERWSWVSALAIATDVFDQTNDSAVRLATFPTTFSPNIVFRCIFFGFFISTLATFGYVTEGGYSMQQLQFKILFVAIAFGSLRYIARNLPKWKHLRWLVDALMIVERWLFF